MLRHMNPADRVSYLTRLLAYAKEDMKDPDTPYNMPAIVDTLQDLLASAEKDLAHYKRHYTC